jgi:hypothetical protein
VKTKDRIGWLLIALAVFSLAKGGGALPIVGPVATAATYVHEKDSSPVPNAVQAALDKLNRERKIVATIYEDSTEDGLGEVPDQYKATVTAARESGLPSLVVVGGDAVIRVVKDPKTAEAVMEAVP